MGRTTLKSIVFGLVTAVTIAGSCLSGLNPVQAAGGNFILSPGKIEVAVTPGQSAIRQVTIKNNTGQTAKFNFGTEDFEGNPDSTESVVKLLGEKDGPNSLKRFLMLQTGSIELPNGGEYSLDVTITIPENTPAGALYGAVTVATESPSDNADVRVSSRLAALIFVKVEGDTFQQGQLINLKSDKTVYTASPAKINFKYSNTGDVYLNPYGLITVKNIFGHISSKTEVKPYFVMPKSTRMSDIQINTEKMFGLYRVKMQLNRGYDNIIDEKGLWIWVLPWQGLVAAGLVLVAVIYLIIRIAKRRPRPHKIFKVKRKK